MVWQCHAINRHSADLVSKENSCVLHRRVKSRKAARDTQHIDGLAQDCRISTVNALESSQSCNRPTICTCGEKKKKRTLLIEEVCTAGPFNSILISQIPQCTSSISHNAPICNEMCTCLLQIGALWDMELVHSGIWPTGLFNFHYIIVTFKTCSRTTMSFNKPDQGMTSNYVQAMKIIQTNRNDNH